MATFSTFPGFPHGFHVGYTGGNAVLFGARRVAGWIHQQFPGYRCPRRMQVGRRFVSALDPSFSLPFRYESLRNRGGDLSIVYYELTVLRLTFVLCYVVSNVCLFIFIDRSQSWLVTSQKASWLHFFPNLNSPP